MKYRIKIYTYENGRKEFIPEYKGKIMWRGLSYKGEVGYGIYQMSVWEDALVAIDLHFQGNNRLQTIEIQYINKSNP